jgi:hypothetical protein
VRQKYVGSPGTAVCPSVNGCRVSVRSANGEMSPPIRAIFIPRKTRPPLPDVEVAVDDAVAEASQRAAVEVGDLHLI